MKTKFLLSVDYIFKQTGDENKENHQLSDGAIIVPLIKLFWRKSDNRRNRRSLKQEACLRKIDTD